MAIHPPKIIFGEMRASGVREVLVYCRDPLQPAKSTAPRYCRGVGTNTRSPI